MKLSNVLLILSLMILVVFIGVKFMETSVDCLLIVGEINIGSSAIDRPSAYGVTMGGQITLINVDNPANASGKITSVEIYASLTGDLQTCEVATFYRPDPDNYPNKFTTRDTHNIGNVIGGAKHTEVVNLSVEEGDYLGITFTVGSIAYSPVDSGYSGVWSKTGDNIPCTNLDFGDILSGGTISLTATNAISIKCKTIDCTLLVNQEGEFYGKTIDGELIVIRDIVGACLNTTQDIRLVVTVDSEDVTGSLVNGIMIAHNKNFISTFAIQLGDPQWSPLTNSHIAINAEVVITAFINGQEIKMFTGLIDNTDTDWNSGYRLEIKGRGYGKKLLEKTMTLISIEQAAKKKYRGAVVEYIAEQEDITNVDVPIGDAIGIDHSFQDQSLWDMIQKECAIEGWFVRFDENGKMICKTSQKKITADWEYGEDKFEELGLETNDRGIINKVTIMGAIFEEEVVTVGESQVEDDDWEPEANVAVDVEKTFADNEVVENWSHTETVYVTDDCKITVTYEGSTTPEGYLFPHYLNYRFEISGLGTIKGTKWTVTGGAQITSKGKTYCNVQRERSDELTSWPPIFLEQEFTITIAIDVGPLIGSHLEWIVDETPNETITSKIVRTQIKATVQDTNSIALYGERKPNNEGTLQFPLAETEAQCKRVGEFVIVESHRYIKQPDYIVAFNPKMEIGCTVKLTDSAIGYDENWVVEEIVHIFDIKSKGEIRARTRIGCVWYA